MDCLRAAVLMCHAPIVIPAIGGTRGRACAASTKAMADAARALVNSGAETVVVISPHLPRPEQHFGWAKGPPLRGDFAAFGHPELEFRFRTSPLPPNFEPRLEALPGMALDHGSTVPLCFLQEAGFQGEVQVFGFPWRRSLEGNLDFGRALRRGFDARERPWALLASGDMSHALQPGGPAPFHPRAAEFDSTVLQLVSEGRLDDLAMLSQELRTQAAEDVLDSLEVATGILGPRQPAPPWCAYEAPFGVGYLIALLQGPPP